MLQDRSELLWMVGARIARPQEPASLSEYGVVIEGAIQKIAEQYPCISVPNYVVIPNHIHMILVVANDGGRAMRAPTIKTKMQADPIQCCVTVYRALAPSFGASKECAIFEWLQ